MAWQVELPVELAVAVELPVARRRELGWKELAENKPLARVGVEEAVARKVRALEATWAKLITYRPAQR